MSAQTTGELPKIAPTPLDIKLRNSRLVMDTPEFVKLAAEWLRNKELDPDTKGLLAVRVEGDTKVL